MNPKAVISETVQIDLEPDGDRRWHEVCNVDQLEHGRGIAVLVEGRPVALFRFSVGDTESLHAVGHIDPRTGTPTIARGLIGSTADEPIVISPLLKDRFSLITGRCLTNDDLSLEIFEARNDGEVVSLRRNVTGEKHV